MNARNRAGALPCLLTILLSFPAAAVDLTGVRLLPLADGFDTVTAITSAGDERLFLAVQGGTIEIVENGEIRPEPFLDLRDRVGNGGEQGLLGLVFHPGYAATGFFFVNYTDLAGDTTIARFRVSDDDGDRAEAASEAVLLKIEQPFVNHNGGALAFGPDGYLYAGTGDGGSGDPECRGQNTQVLLGKILRLDVDANVSEAPFHAVPPSNPFVSGGGLPEIWSYGLRNPWRISFDRLTGDLFIADVGEKVREEVNRQPASSVGGENYAWKVMEGTSCHANLNGCPASVRRCGAAVYTLPVLEYDYGQAGADFHCSVIGGYVYRGDSMAQLRGAYVYGDFCSGTLWAAFGAGAAWESEEIGVQAPGLTTFGEDADGELYLAANGTLYQMVADAPEPCQADATTLCLNGDRFEVTVDWATSDDGGQGQGSELTEDGGYFTFFGPRNPEVFVKVLDACQSSNRYWVFAAGLTNVGVVLTVHDTLTGEVRVWENDLGEKFESIQDTSAFTTCP